MRLHVTDAPTSGAGRPLCISAFSRRDRNSEDDRIDVIAWLTARLKWPIGCQGARYRVELVMYVCDTCAYVEGWVLWTDGATPDISLTYTRPHTRARFLARALCKFAAATAPEWHWPCQSTPIGDCEPIICYFQLATNYKIDDINGSIVVIATVFSLSREKIINIIFLHVCARTCVCMNHEI